MNPTRIQVARLCPNWAAQKANDPKTSRNEHIAAFPNCGCGHSDGEQWQYSWVDIREVFGVFGAQADAAPVPVDVDATLVQTSEKKRRGRPKKGETKAPEQTQACVMCGAEQASEVCNRCGASPADEDLLA